MKIKQLILIITLIFSLNACLSPDYSFSSKKSLYSYDFYEYDDGFCEVICANGSVYYSKQDTFRYMITIYGIEPNTTVILNSFKLTNKKNEPISAKYCVEMATDTVGIRVSPSVKNFVYEEFEIDTLPIVFRDANSYKIYGTSITIMAKTYTQIKDLDVVKVEYDFQVGDKQYVSDNIIYKRRLRMPLEGHEWSPSILR